MSSRTESTNYVCIRGHSEASASRLVEESTEQPLLAGNLAKQPPLSSPISQVPHDIFTTILETCLPDVESEYADSISLEHPSIVLSQVCQSWRATTLGWPRMWARFHVEMPTVPWNLDPRKMPRWEREMGQLTRGVRLWIARSRCSPLSVRVTGWNMIVTAECPGVAKERYEEFISEFSPASLRWKHLWIQMTHFPGIRGDIHLPVTPHPVTAPHLETFTITGRQVPAGLAPSLNLPSLKNLHLSPSPPRAAPLKATAGLVECILHFGQGLKSLSFPHLFVESAVWPTILEALPNVEFLRLYCGAQRAFTVSANEKVFEADCYILQLLNRRSAHKGTIYLPHLRRFHLELTNAYYSDAWKKILVEGMIMFITTRREAGHANVQPRLEEVLVRFPWMQDPGDLDLRQELEGLGPALDDFRLHVTYKERLDLGVFLQ